LEANAYSSDYILMGDGSVSALVASLESVQNAASEILTTLFAAAGGKFPAKGTPDYLT